MALFHSVFALRSWERAQMKARALPVAVHALKRRRLLLGMISGGKSVVNCNAKLTNFVQGLLSYPNFFPNGFSEGYM